MTIFEIVLLCITMFQVFLIFFFHFCPTVRPGKRRRVQTAAGKVPPLSLKEMTSSSACSYPSAIFSRLYIQSSFFVLINVFFYFLRCFLLSAIFCFFFFFWCKRSLRVLMQIMTVSQSEKRGKGWMWMRIWIWIHGDSRTLSVSWKILTY